MGSFCVRQNFSETASLALQYREVPVRKFPQRVITKLNCFPLSLYPLCLSEKPKGQGIINLKLPNANRRSLQKQNEATLQWQVNRKAQFNLQRFGLIRATSDRPLWNQSDHDQMRVSSRGTVGLSHGSGWCGSGWCSLTLRVASSRPEKQAAGPSKYLWVFSRPVPWAFKVCLKLLIVICI